MTKFSFKVLNIIYVYILLSGGFVFISNYTTNKLLIYIYRQSAKSRGRISIKSTLAWKNKLVQTNYPNIFKLNVY